MTESALQRLRSPNRARSIREGGTPMSSSDSKSRILRLAEWRESRLASRGPWPRRAAVLGTTIALTAGTGIAYAAWNSSGAGSGYAKAGSATTPTTTTLDATAVTSGVLYPGGPSGDVFLKVNNPGSYPFKVTGVTGNGAITGNGGTGVCTTTGVSFTDQSIASGSQVSIPGGGNATIKLSGAVSMNNTSDNGCQTALFTIPVTVAVTSG